MKKQYFLDNRYLGTFNLEQIRKIRLDAKNKGYEICEPENQDYICIFTDIE
jgi:hypothetical protein